MKSQVESNSGWSLQHIGAPRWLWARVGLLMVLIAYGISDGYAQVTSIDDQLTAPNPGLWSVEGNAPGIGSIANDARGLVLTLQPGKAARGISSTCFLSGDFDVEVAINLINWPVNNLYGLRLGAVDLGTGPFGEVGIYREGGSEFYTVAFTNGSVHSATVGADRENKLRLKRQGNLLSGFFLANGGSNWIQVGGTTAIGPSSTDPTRFNLDISSSNDSAGGVTVAFSNFHVNTGTIACGNPIVILPGILGTSLFRETAPITPNALLWIDGVQAVISPSDDFLRQLALGSDGSSLVQIQPGPILDGSLAAGLVNAYGGLTASIKQAGYQENALLFTFPYDWRLDNRTTASNLSDFIENVVIPKSGHSKVDIVAHSMGGLVARDYALRFGQQRLDKVIYIGTPHIGSPTAFGPLAFNDPLVEYFVDFPFINSETMAQISRTFPSSFQLLSREPFIFSSSLQRDLSINETYLQPPQGFGFLASSAWVESAHAFHQTLAGQLTVPQFEIASSGVATLTQLVLQGGPSTGPRVWCARSGNGDGTVPIQSATAVPGSATAFYLDTVKHADLPNNKTAQQLVLQILRNNLNSLPAGVNTQFFPLPGVVEWCSGSPIKVTITDPQSRADGVSTDGSVRTQIPLSSFYVFEANESGLLPPSQEYGVKIVATGTGVFSLTFDQKDASGMIAHSTKFSEIPIAAGAIGTFLLSPGQADATLALDIDGNGSIDLTLPANEPLTPAASNNMLGRVIRSFRLHEEIRESLVEKVRDADRAVHQGHFGKAEHVYNALRHELKAQSGKHITTAQARGLTTIIDSLIKQIEPLERDQD